jgi:hypothetical protein
VSCQHCLSVMSTGKWSERAVVHLNFVCQLHRLALLASATMGFILSKLRNYLGRCDRIIAPRQPQMAHAIGCRSSELSPKNLVFGTILRAVFSASAMGFSSVKVGPTQRTLTKVNHKVTQRTNLIHDLPQTRCVLRCESNIVVLNQVICVYVLCIAPFLLSSPPSPLALY